MSSVPADVIVDLHRLFRRLNVGWYVFGAQAAAMHGAARLTVDVGVTVALGEVSTKALARALMSEGFDLRITDDEFVERTRVLPAVHSTSGIPVDIVLAGPGIEELFLERAQRRDIRGIKVPVACPEDIAVMKILAGRAKDIDDVLAIVRATGNDFRRKLARETLDLLEQALDRRDLLPLLEQVFKDAASVTTPSRRRPGEKTQKVAGQRRRSAKLSRRKASKKAR
jgi:hypothetical protein